MSSLNDFSIAGIYLYLHKSHNTPLLPPQICICIVLDFLWDTSMSQYKLQTIVMDFFFFFWGGGVYYGIGARGELIL